jgi:hypothetical protein
MVLGWRPQPADVADILFLLAAAEQAAPLWGVEGIANVRATRRAFVALGVLPPDRRRRNFDIDWGDVGGFAERLGRATAKTVLSSYGLGGVADQVGLGDPKPKQPPAKPAEKCPCSEAKTATAPSGPSETTKNG